EIGARITLDRVVQVRELERVAKEEDRSVVTDEVPVAVFGVELDRETADVALGVGRATLSGDGRESSEQVGLLTDFREDLRVRVLGDVGRDRERAVRTGPLRVHATFGDDLAVEMRKLLQEPDVLEKLWPSGSGRDDILVVGYGGARPGRQVVLAHRRPSVKRGPRVECAWQPPPRSGCDRNGDLRRHRRFRRCVDDHTPPPFLESVKKTGPKVPAYG